MIQNFNLFICILFIPITYAQYTENPYIRGVSTETQHYTGTYSSQEQATQTQTQEQSYVKTTIIAQRRNVKSLNYLIFGTSVSWGSGLQNRTAEAYPYLLSPNVKNLAMRACGPNYPSVCTQSMVNDEADTIYDVIILEYMTGSQDGLIPLAKRLRQRYPDAKIIFMCLWYPLMMYYMDGNTGQKISVQKWITETLKVHDYQNRDASQIVIPALRDSTEAWVLDMEFLQRKINYHSSIAQDVQGYIYYGPNIWYDPSKTQFTFDHVKDMVLQYHTYYNSDWLHLSPTGHTLVANTIHAILEQNLLGPIPPTHDSTTLGDWGKGDACYSWYENGKDVLPHSPSIYMENFQKSVNAKYALSVPFSQSSATSATAAIKVNNPFSEPRQLVLSYMTTGPDKTIYPNVEVQVYNFQNGFISDAVLIYPISSNYNHPVHVVQSKNIALVPPGENSILIQSLQTSNDDTSMPFRVVAVSITDGSLEPSKNFQGPASLV